MLADLADRQQDAAFATEVRRRNSTLVDALRAQWRGDHFNRAYLYDRSGRAGEIGKDDLWLAANGAALIANELLAPAAAGRLVERMSRELLGPSPLGFASRAAPDLRAGTVGFWYSLAGLAVEGLAKSNAVPGARELAWSAFWRQTLATHAETYPNIWYGVWSGSDMYYTPLDATMSPLDPAPIPGGTWEMEYVFLVFFKIRLSMRDFPVTNMFSHSEPLLGGVRMAGVWANADGLTVDPVFPTDTFTWESRLFAVSTTSGETRGRVTAMADDTLKLRVRVRGLAPAERVSVFVGGQPVPLAFDADFVVFDLPVKQGVAADWAVRREG